MIKINNIVNSVNVGVYPNIKEMTPEEIKKDFISADEEPVILSLEKSYELSGNKKLSVLYAIIISAALLFTTTSNFALSKSTNNDLLGLAGIFSGIALLGMTLVGIINFNIINDISNYTKEAELHILDVKPEAMKDLLQKKYENTTGARIKSLFNRNKKKEEI